MGEGGGEGPFSPNASGKQSDPKPPHPNPLPPAATARQRGESEGRGKSATPHPRAAVPTDPNGALGETRPATQSSSGVLQPLWNIYYRVTMVDAIEFGLVEVINRAQGTFFTREQFLESCRGRARDEEIFQQAYMCNPAGAASNRIVEWSAIERCRFDYQIERVHLEAEQVRQQFGEFSPSQEAAREHQIHQFLRNSFPSLLGLFPHASSSSTIQHPSGIASVSMSPPAVRATWQ